MATHELFSFQRIRQLAQNQYVMDRKTTWLGWGGIIIAITFVLLVGQSLDHNYLRWNNKSYFGTFLMFYFVGGIAASANSFKWLRSKEARYAYLMIPATALEKFTFEFFSKIVAFLLLTPFVFWIVANTEGYIFHLFQPNFLQYRFSFFEGFSDWDLFQKGFWGVWLLVNGVLLCFTISFTGSTYFKKNPFPKLLLSLAVILVTFIIYYVILIKILGLYNYVHIEHSRVTPLNRHVVGIILFLFNLVCLAISYFNIKEKEV
jgi:hypothetical protein